MKLSRKLSAGAVAMALAGSAFAAIDNGTSTPAGHTLDNGELFLSVWDAANAKSYVRDLGVRIDSFLPTGPVTAFGYTQTWGADAAWVSFVDGLGPTQIAALKYDVVALDPANVAQRQRYLTTTNATITNTTSPFNQTLGQFGAVKSYVDAVNNLAATQNPATAGPGGQHNQENTAANNAVVALSSDGSAYFGTGTVKGEQWSGKSSFVTTALVGQSLDVYLLTQSSGSPTARSLFDKYDNALGDATFTLAADGALTFMAPVPEPETYALMIAGLALVGAAARRRRSS